ncbi:hypothetical protein [Bacillus sp. BP-3]|uniref:hypothetical protein n=1 Tax=Bacillus sp. BP-3 TaxID=3022773 RepID=UPI00232E18F1|nr:hypothetical protein [Bacillus sp. BP-3]MDC2864384.1 hypothetical protein [Bacillus sp. BP-3]
MKWIIGIAVPLMLLFGGCSSNETSIETKLDIESEKENKDLVENYLNTLTTLTGKLTSSVEDMRNLAIRS